MQKTFKGATVTNLKYNTTSLPGALRVGFVVEMISPSPQCVGQEFVRQYYTMLHEAPDFMHR